MKNKLLDTALILLGMLFVIKGAVTLIGENWVPFSISLSGFFIVLLFYFLRNHFPLVRISLFSRWLFLAFIFASMYLGSLDGYYGRYVWWDTLLHFLAGMLFAFAFFSASRGKIKMTGLTMVIFFSFFASSSLNSWWEIFEFALDHVPEINTQRGGLEDTMVDILSANLGASLVFLNFLLAKKLRGFR